MDWRPRAEHVWVADIALGGDRRAPGLLLGWRRGTTTWCGWCVIATPGIGAHGDGPYTQLRWVDAAAIIPLDPPASAAPDVGRPRAGSAQPRCAGGGPPPRRRTDSA